MRYTLNVVSYAPSRPERVQEAVEKGMKRRYDDDLAVAMQEFLKKYFGDTLAIVKVTLNSAGSFIVETTKPLTDFILAIEDMLKAQFHTHAKVECIPL